MASDILGPSPVFPLIILTVCIDDGWMVPFYDVYPSILES
jgi:hypothetical protein